MDWNIWPADSAPEGWWHAWQMTNETHMAGHPLLGAEMTRLLLKYFGGNHLRFAALGPDSGPHLQLVLERTAWGRWRVFTPSQSPVAQLVFDRANVDAVRQLMGLLRIRSVAGAALTLPYQDPAFAVLGGHTDARVSRRPLGTTIAVASESGFESYWSSRSKDLRRNMKRYQSRAEAEGHAPRLEIVESPESIAEAVDRYGILESRGWKSDLGTALHPSNVQGSFYRELLQTLAQHGCARAYELYFADRLVASRLLVSSPAMHVILKTTYDEDLKAFAPGRLHLYLMISALLSAGDGRSIEFYTKANRDTLSWATSERVIEEITVYRNNLIATAARCRDWWKARRQGGA